MKRYEPRRTAPASEISNFTFQTDAPLLRRIFRRNTLLGMVALVALGAVAWRMLSQSDERIIRRTMREAALALEKDGAENPIVAARRAERVAEILTPTPVIVIGVGMDAHWRSRSEVRSAIFRARAAAEQIAVSLHDISVTVDPSREQAVLTGTARVRGVTQHDRSEGREFIEFSTEWTKTPDGWRLAVLRRVEAVRRID